MQAIMLLQLRVLFPVAAWPTLARASCWFPTGLLSMTVHCCRTLWLTLGAEWHVGFRVCFRPALAVRVCSAVSFHLWFKDV